MQPQSLKSKVAKGAVWTLMEKLSTQVVQFVVGMILARLLTPDDYGTVALTAIFFAVANALVDGGFGNALIHKKDADDLDFNSVFYLNLTFSIVAYVILFLAAPLIASFYHVPSLVVIVRVAAVAVIFNAINAIQNAELTKKMLFHLSFRISLITSLTSAVFGITLAFMGCGVWALVWSSLASGLVGVVARWFIISWRPKLLFSVSRLRPLFAYGWKIAVSGVIDRFFVNLNGLLIGKCYSKMDLAYVNKGNGLPNLVMNEVDATLGRVSWPALVLLQDDKAKLRSAMRRMIQCSTFLVLPMMVGLAACSYSLLRLLYGPRWTPAAPYMMLACFSFALWPFHTINLKGIMALGRSDIYLKLEIIKKAMMILATIIALRYGVLVFMAVSAFVLGPLCVVVNAWPNRHLLGYTLRMQIQDVMPTALICVAEALVVFGVDLVGERVASFLTLKETGGEYMLFLSCKVMLQFVFGALTFFILAYVFRLKPMGEYVRMCSQLAHIRFPRIAHLIEQRFRVLQ